ncbi:hypothetical protein JW960_01655 [candidate division KSB1 bacterium]|nr:hypothetical protein [candidate division KSB1 bacterium]
MVKNWLKIFVRGKELPQDCKAKVKAIWHLRILNNQNPTRINQNQAIDIDRITGFYVFTGFKMNHHVNPIHPVILSKAMMSFPRVFCAG